MHIGWWKFLYVFMMEETIKYQKGDNTDKFFMPGDMIAIRNAWKPYHHMALYAGNEKVYHIYAS